VVKNPIELLDVVLHGDGNLCGVNSAAHPKIEKRDKAKSSKRAPQKTQKGNRALNGELPPTIEKEEQYIGKDGGALKPKAGLLLGRGKVRRTDEGGSVPGNYAYTEDCGG